MRLRTPAALLATAVLAVGLGSITTASAAQSAGDEVYACVNKKTRYARIVYATTKCRPTEVADSWARNSATGQVGVNTRGPQGETGARGPQGERGLTGQTGPQGQRGLTGPMGPKGATGEAGAKGPQGNTGPAGTPGKDGTDGRDGVDGQDGGLPATYAYKVGPVWTTCKLIPGYAIAAYDCKVGQAPPKAPASSSTPDGKSDYMPDATPSPSATK